MAEAFDAQRIGGSSAGAVLGISPWESTLALWERLRGGSTATQWAEEEQARLEAGAAMEPLIAARAAKLYGFEFGDRPLALVHPEEPRIVGHLDAIGLDGQPAEFKLTGQRVGVDGWGEPDTDQVPAHYLAQCMHYLALLPGAPSCTLFALRIPSYRLDRYVIQRDQVLCEVLLARERALLDQVDAGVAPDPATEAEARRLWFATSPKKRAVATPGVLSALMRRWVAGRLKAVCDKAIAAANLEVLRCMQDAEELVGDGGDVAATFKSNRVFDERSFLKRNPSAEEECKEFSKELAKEYHPLEYEKAMRPAMSPDEGVRQLRLSKTFAEACRRLVAGEACTLPFLPEVGQMFQEDAIDG